MKRVIQCAFLVCFSLSGMAQTTGNPLNLNIPDPHTPNWGPIVNSNFVKLNLSATSINGHFGLFTFNGPGVSCTTLTCTFSGTGTGVASINGTGGAFTFTGPGVSCTTTTCTFSGGGGGSGTVTNFLAPSGSWPSWLVPTVTNSTTTPSLAVAASAIPNSALANPSMTVNGVSCVLGSTCTVTASGLSGQTTGFLPIATSATGSTTSSALQDTGTSLIYHGTGTAHGFTMPEGTSIAGVASSDVLWSDATSHRWIQNPNNIGALMIPGIATAGTSGDCVKLAANGIDLLDNGSACGTGGGGITALTGDVTATGPGSVAATLATSGVTAGSYTAANITVDAKGRVTAAANGSAGTVNSGTAFSPAYYPATGTAVSGVTPFSGFQIDNASAAPRVAVQSDFNPFLTSPGPIGSSAPNTGSFTSLSATGTTTLATGLSGCLTATAGVVSSTGIACGTGGGGFANPMTTAGDLIDGGSGGTAQRLGIGTTGQVLMVAGGVPTWSTPASGGSVTSVAATVPTGFTIGGSPITTSGTLAIGLTTESAGSGFMGPASGAAATPTWRAFVSADIPNNAANTTGNASTATALAATPTQCTGGQFATGITASGNANCATGATGTVTSFSAGTLSPLFTTSVATATTTPALSFALSTAAANTVFGNFTGSTATPTFSDAPVFSAANLTSFPTFNQSTTGNAATATLAANSSLLGGVALSGICQTGGSGCPAAFITSLTTTGTSGAATVSGGVLNIPNYATGGGSGFSVITSGTNTTAAMVVGAGATLNFTSSGTINASSVGGVALSGLCQTAGTGCPQLPVTKALVSHQFFTSYTNTSGVFTAAQPAFTDISGQTTLAQLPTLSANTVLGALTATTPSGLAVPSCSGATNALIWTSGTGFGCNTISGIGTVTSFSAGNLSPLFTTSVATATSTPSLTFTLSTAAQNSVLAGPPTGGIGAPSYQTAPTLSAANMTGLLLSGLATQAANTVVGNGTASTAFPSALAMPSCSTTTSALIWTSATGFGCHTVTAGALAWSVITNPTTNLALTMAADTTVFTFNAATGTADLFKWTDTASNTGTGILGHFTTASGSTEVPWQADANGVGWQVNNSGQMANVGATASGNIQFGGSTSGTATVTAQAVMGTPTLTLPNTTGTFAVGASGPLTLNATTGALTIATASSSVLGAAECDGTTITCTSGIFVAVGGGGLAFPKTVSGTTTSGGIPYFSNVTTLTSSGILNTNVLVKGGGAGGAPTNSLFTDTGTTATYTGTGGIASPTFTSTGTTAGFMDFAQGTTSAAVAPCNTATSICFQAPTSVTSYLVNLPGAAATGIVHWSNASSVVTQSISAVSLTADVSGVLPFANMAQYFVVNAQTATYQVIAADFLGCKTIPVASGTFTITLVASTSQPASGQCLDIINYGTGVVTVARSGQNLNGGTTSLTLAAGSATAPTGAHVVSDGTNYEAALWGGTGGGSGTVTSVGFTGGLISVATATTTPALTVAGTSGGVPFFSSGTTWGSSGALTANVLTKGGGAGAAPTNSLLTDTGTTITYTGTGGIAAPSFTSTGTTAGFVDYPQGTTSVAVAPCNTTTSICEQAPASVTSYLVNKPGAAAQGVVTGTLSGSTITQGISGDSGHSATVTIGSGTSIGSTSLCSTTLCPAGTYRVNTYVDVTTACGTTGTYTVNLIYTDDQGLKTAVINLNGTGSVPATGLLTTTSTSNFGQESQIIRSTGATSINYSTAAVACGTAGPMVGKLYMSVEAVQ